MTYALYACVADFADDMAHAWAPAAFARGQRTPRSVYGARALADSAAPAAMPAYSR